jgi:hypothetical protein
MRWFQLFTRASKPTFGLNSVVLSHKAVNSLRYTDHCRFSASETALREGS